ncbi:MAG: hypothetical protein V4644_02930 [Patescibacteria group bacterium]
MPARHTPYVVIEKALGQTPLAALEAWRARNPAHAALPATYAGRLDPMAEGKLLVLLGEECKRQEAYRGLDKQYEIEVVLGLETDTGDALGMPSEGSSALPSAAAIRKVVRSLEGTVTLPYPAYSSKTVAGKPLFQYALEGTLGTIEIPTHTETLYRIRHHGTTRIPKAELEEWIADILSRAPRAEEASKELGRDFRQDDIRAAWTALFRSMQRQDFMLLRLCVTAGSGAYMRTLAERIGALLGMPGMALSIRRTKIGTYRTLLGKGFWTKEYR